MIICGNCKTEKDDNEFWFIKTLNRYDKNCRLCKAKYARERKHNNPDAKKKALDYNKTWYNEKGKEWKKEYESINREHINTRDREKYATDSDFRMKKIMRNRLSSTINGTKVYNKTLNSIGIHLNLFKKWIEYQFNDKMNWENQGIYWTYDHVIPFDFYIKNKKENPHIWFNLKPLYSIENYSKNNKLLDISDHIKNIINFSKKHNIELGIVFNDYKVNGSIG
jgi:hypothetical protein